MPTDKQTAALARARSFLFVPGNRPERFAKALASGADAIVLDLEDAVPADEKATTRAAIAAAWPDLRQAAIPVVVRMNPPALDCGREDLQLLASLDAPAAVMVPKAESGEDLAGVRSALPATALLPMIESAVGYTALATVAGAAGVLRLVLGDLDFMADTGLQCSADATELAPLRFAIAISTRTNQLAPAVEGVTADFRNDDLLRADTRRALRFGFGAKLCIHPHQIPIVHATLRPTTAEINWAKRVLEADAAAGGSAVQLDGQMVDLAVVLQARRLLARVPEEDA